MAHQVGRHRTAAETLLPTAVTLTNDDKVALVVANHLEKRSTRLTVTVSYTHLTLPTSDLV